MAKSTSVIIFDIETIERLTKDRTSASILIKNSKIADDDIILAMIIKEKLLTYECSAPSCSVKLSWRRKPIKLILNRKNGHASDLRIENLELLCPNCYSQQYNNWNLLKKTLQPKSIICRVCGYDKVHMLAEVYRKAGYCQFCFKKIQISQESMDTTVKTELLLLRSLESAKNGGENVEFSDSMIASISENIRQLATPADQSATGLNDMASLMSSSSASSTRATFASSSKIRKPRTLAEPSADSEPSVPINCMEDIDISDMIQ